MNGNNLIIYNIKISKDKISEFINFYSTKIGQFYLNNNLTDKTIKNEKIIFVICNSDFNEWNNAEKFKKKQSIKIKETLNLDKVTNIYDLTEILNHKINENNEAEYFYNPIVPIFYLKIGKDNRKKYIYSIVEYHNHLIKLNLLKNEVLKSLGQNTFFNYLFIHGIINYLGNQFYVLFYNTSSGNFLYENDIKIDDNANKIIYDYLLKNSIINYWKDGFTYANLLEHNNISKLNNFDVLCFFWSYLVKKYGIDWFYNLLKYLYNGNYKSGEEIFSHIFKIDSKRFLLNLDKEINKLIFESK